jgi:hypothetical protein
MDTTTPVEKNAPNPEKKDDTQNHLDNNDDEVTSILSLNFTILQTLNCSFANIPFRSFHRINLRMIFLRNKTSNFQRKQLLRPRSRKKLMKTRALKIMNPTRLMVIGSNQKRLMKKRTKRNKMGPTLKLEVSIPMTLTWTQASLNPSLVFLPNQLKLVRPKKLRKIQRVSLKLRLVAQKSFQPLRLRSSLQA